MVTFEIVLKDEEGLHRQRWRRHDPRQKRPHEQKERQESPGEGMRSQVGAVRRRGKLEGWAWQNHLLCSYKYVHWPWGPSSSPSFHSSLSQSRLTQHLVPRPPAHPHTTTGPSLCPRLTVPSPAAAPLFTLCLSSGMPLSYSALAPLLPGCLP